MPLMRVFNAVGSSEEKYQQFLDVSRETGNEKTMHPLEWWKNRKKVKQDSHLYCNELTCRNTAEVGAHVIDADSCQHVYITPLCKGCNNKTDESFYVYDSNLVECTHIGVQRELLRKSQERYNAVNSPK